MSDGENSYSSLRARYRTLNSQWAELCDRYLPVLVPDSIWRYSRYGSGADPEQGWKLHVSATILSAVHVLQKVGPLLSARNVWFKAPVSLNDLDQLNRGTVYSYSQVGKFLTIYPRTTKEAVQLARELHNLTSRLPCPEVPFDLKYLRHSCVYYRYGAFKTIGIENSERVQTDVLRGPDNKLIPDVRDSVFIPEWVTNPFPPPRRGTLTRPTPLQTTFKVFRAFSQRGKGGVYQAVDLSVTPARFCVVKQGRRHGEESWDGRDGAWRVKNEKRVLTALVKAGIEVPAVYSSFRSRNSYYLVAEFIDGESLYKWLRRRKRRLSIAAALKRSTEVARLIARIHAAGWVWRDCKPGNIIVSTNGKLRPLDFEGACRVEEPDLLPWSTPGYVPSESANRSRGETQIPEDLYSLGVIIYLLFAGRLPDECAPAPLRWMRKNVPAPVKEIVGQLLHLNPQQRPCARTVALRLEAALRIATASDVKVAA